MEDWHKGLPSLPAYKPVEASLYCHVTRIRLRSIRSLPIVWRSYVDIQRQARQIPQIKRCVFLLQDLRTFFILSIWEGDDGFIDFGTRVGRHGKAIARTFPRIALHNGKPEVWSTQWKIRAVSKSMNWGDSQEWTNALADRC